MVDLGPLGDVPSWLLALGAGVGLFILEGQGLIPSKFPVPFIDIGVSFDEIGGLLILVGIAVMLYAFYKYFKNT